MTRQLHVEQLEDRRLLTSTLFVDFGDLFPVAGLTAVAALDAIGLHAGDTVLIGGAAALCARGADIAFVAGAQAGVFALE